MNREAWNVKRTFKNIAKKKKKKEKQKQKGKEKERKERKSILNSETTTNNVEPKLVEKHLPLQWNVITIALMSHKLLLSRYCVAEWEAIGNVLVWFSDGPKLDRLRIGWVEWFNKRQTSRYKQ